MNEGLPFRKPVARVPGRRQRFVDESGLNRIVFKYRNSHGFPRSVRWLLRRKSFVVF
ncbi:hypothetical protein [Paraburkholderia ginsengisoli]|uniref:hypothetical protein n=1 Tax=Paraburkholderia ginsengisoli TaxID=311231 RepID=UPI001E532F04|nr:hypothetical protein [Paraburkholderia ginsengisoli]